MSDDSSEKTGPKLWSVPAAILVPIGTIIISQMAIVVLGEIIGWRIYDENSPDYQTYIYSMLSALLPLAGLWYYLSRRNISLSALGFKRLQKRYVWLTLVIFCLYFSAILVIFGLTSVLIPEVDLNQEQELGFDNPTLPVQYLSLFVVLVVLTPISEEVLFRGFMFQGLKWKYGWVAAAVVSALIFGLIHGQLNVGIDTAVLGMFSAWLMHKSGSIFPSIGLHAIKNGLAFVALFFLGG